MKSGWCFVVVGALWACGEAAQGSPSAPPIVLRGAVEKGPLLAGSTVLVSSLDASGLSTGGLFTTTTSDDRGQFELEVRPSELLAIDGSGFYYDESAGSSSTGSVALRGMYRPAEAETGTLYVNAITHLTYARIQKLLADGVAFEAAREQAEHELQLALKIVAPTFTAGVSGSRMSVLGGDTDGSAYLLAVSAVLTQAARELDAAAPHAGLEWLLAQLSLDLQQTGAFSSELAAIVAAGVETLDVAGVERGLGLRLAALGSSATAPDLDRILDQDGDGLPNASDDCPRGAGGNACQTLLPGRLDVLFMIDNSISMADKQRLLQLAVPDLVGRLINPICIDGSGARHPAPAPGADCPAGQRRELEPVTDLHVGVITSSLGDAGANVVCPDQGFPRYVPDRIDLAHLMGSLERGQGTANTAEGFLAWRAGETSVSTFNGQLQDMVTSTGIDGCAWEGSLESWYRFLVDPFPYRQLVRVACPGSASTAPNCVQQAVDAGNHILLDETLLAQRAAFLRPDSRLAIIMLSDENDCSLQIGNQTWVVAAVDDSRPMFRGSSECARDPNAKCCYSCPLGPPDGCQVDPICNADPVADVLEDRLPASEDGQSLRCYQQKRRFGVDFLYPTRRYVNALAERELCWNDLELDTSACAPADIVANPLYAGGRSPSDVFLGGIVGVPWQLIASDIDAERRPLATGQLRFQSPAELEERGTWDLILGSPGRAWRPARANAPEVTSIAATPPASPYMVESALPRAGVTAGNAINGREYSTVFTSGTTDTPDDLEYACIYPLAAPIDCTTVEPGAEPCSCFPGDVDRPTCEQTPGASAAGTTQYWGFAYPGIRQLEVLRAQGENGIVASVCARNVADADASDFGYRPAIDAIVERLAAPTP
jgi:hypothetical protein